MDHNQGADLAEGGTPAADRTREAGPEATHDRAVGRTPEGVLAERDSPGADPAAAHNPAVGRTRAAGHNQGADPAEGGTPAAGPAADRTSLDALLSSVLSGAGC